MHQQYASLLSSVSSELFVLMIVLLQLVGVPYAPTVGAEFLKYYVIYLMVAGLACLPASFFWMIKHAFAVHWYGKLQKSHQSVWSASSLVATVFSAVIITGLAAGLFADLVTLMGLVFAQVFFTLLTRSQSILTEVVSSIVVSLFAVVPLVLMMIIDVWFTPSVEVLTVPFVLLVMYVEYVVWRHATSPDGFQWVRLAGTLLKMGAFLFVVITSLFVGAVMSGTFD